MKHKPQPLPSPKRSRLIGVKYSEREYQAVSDQSVNENLASVSAYIRKASLDRANYHFTPTQMRP
jgi:hypothetical protein